MPTNNIKNKFNNAVETGTFPEQLKYTDVKPVFKEDSQTAKKI